MQKADEKFCDDFGALALLAVLSNLGSDQAKEACANFARKRYGRPKRVIDLYLRSSPDSPAREALWNYFNGDDRYKAKVAAQGGDGVLTRLSMLALFAIGLLGAILLLAWLAIRLFTQAAIAFVLLLVAPFALFFPMLGDAGRRAFKTWGLTLLGAIAAKVIYAAFLSIVLLGISILGQVDGPGGSATGFLLSCAFTWAVFLKRAELVGWMSIGEAEPGAGRLAGKVAAFTLARRMSQSTGGAVKGVGRRGANWARGRAAERGEATRETAKGSLQESARALADQRYRQAKRTVGRLEGVESEPAPDGDIGPGAARGRRGGKERKLRLALPSRSLRRGRGRIAVPGPRGRPTTLTRAMSRPARSSLEPIATSASSASAGAIVTWSALKPRTASCCGIREIPPTTPTAPAMTAPSSKSWRGQIANEPRRRSRRRPSEIAKGWMSPGAFPVG